VSELSGSLHIVRASDHVFWIMFLPRSAFRSGALPYKTVVGGVAGLEAYLAQQLGLAGHTLTEAVAAVKVGKAATIPGVRVAEERLRALRLVP
jgi:hypothetical protein